MSARTRAVGIQCSFCHSTVDDSLAPGIGRRRDGLDCATQGAFTHTKGGFFHDGCFATLLDVVAHYEAVLGLKLDEKQKKDLVEYLKSL